MKEIWIWIGIGALNLLSVAGYLWRRDGSEVLDSICFAGASFYIASLLYERKLERNHS